MLRLLHVFGVGAALSRPNTQGSAFFSQPDKNGRTQAYIAGHQGHEGVLRVLHELGAGASLSQPSKNGHAPACIATLNGHTGVLRVLHELGAGASFSQPDKNERTPAFVAAQNAHYGVLVLRVLHELGAIFVYCIFKMQQLYSKSFFFGDQFIGECPLRTVQCRFYLTI